DGAVGGEIEEDFDGAGGVFDLEAAVGRDHREVAGGAAFGEAGGGDRDGGEDADTRVHTVRDEAAGVDGATTGGGRDEGHLGDGGFCDVAEVHQRAGLEADGFEAGFQGGVGFELIDGFG